LPFKSQLKVLIVDDTTTSRALLRSGLDEIGVTNVTFAVDGADAIAKINSAAPNLIISDINMPKVDGIKLLQSIRHYGPTAKMAFIVLTSNSDKSVFQHAVSLGVNNYLMKPFTTDSLRTSIEAVVGKLM
jgi:two-component system, chemotaxis family, chemotaxis protein CheY